MVNNNQMGLVTKEREFSHLEKTLFGIAVGLGLATFVVPDQKTKVYLATTAIPMRWVAMGYSILKSRDIGQLEEYEK